MRGAAYSKRMPEGTIGLANRDSYHCCFTPQIERKAEVTIFMPEGTHRFRNGDSAIAVSPSRLGFVKLDSTMPR
jgi:hypothetical protein